MGRDAKFAHNDAIKAVMFMIWRQGYEQVSVKSISEKLGITRSSFYHAFGSREELFKKVLSFYNDYTPLTHLQQLEKNAHVLPAIAHTFKALCEMRANDNMHKGCLAMNSLAELHHTEEKENEVLCHLSEQLMINNKYLESLLERAVKQRELPLSANIKAVALCITNLFIGINIMSKAVHSEEELWLAASTTLKGLDIIK